MLEFKTVFYLEFKQITNKKNLYTFFVIIFLLVLLAIDGKNKFYSFQITKIKFQESEAAKVNSYMLYSQYSGYGLRLKYFPSPFFILNNLNVIENLTAHINAGDRLDIYNNVKGENLFRGTGGFLDYSGISMILIGFFSIFYGLDSFGNNEYLKFLKGLLRSNKKVFSYIYMSRLIIIELLIILSIAVTNLWILIRGTNLFNSNLFVYSLLSVLTSVFFFSVGSIFGKKDKLKLAGIYFLLIVLIPLGIIKISGLYHENIMNTYSQEVKALDIVMSAESRIRSTSMATPDKIIDGLFKNEYKILKEQEKRIFSSIKSKIKQIHFLASIFPTSFYSSVTREMSGGFLSCMDFYNFAIEKKDEFIKFYYDKKLQKAEQGRGKLENFIKGDDNIFFAKPHLPFYFSLGITITILGILITTIISYKRLGKRMVCEKNFEDVELSLKKNIPGYFLTKDSCLENFVFYAFFDNTSIITVDGETFKGHGCFYIPKIEELPFVTNRTWMSVLRIKVEKTRGWGTWKLFFEAGISSGKIILSNSLIEGRKGDEIIEMKKTVAENGSVWLEIGGDRHQWEKTENNICWKNDTSIDLSDYNGLLKD